MQSSPQMAIADSAAHAEAELVRQGYQDLPLGMGTTFFASTGLAWVVAEGHVYPPAWRWLAVMAALVAGRSATVFRYRREERGPGPHRFWRKVFIAGAALTGLGWGYAAWTFYPILGDLELSLLILVIAGITAGATRSLGPVLPACVLFQICCMGPLVARALLADAIAQTVMGGLAILYTAFLIATARSYHQSLDRSLRLGYESAALAEQLKARQQQAEILNQELRAEVAHRREIESELRAAKERAESASRAKSDFLATISHEIRTPMNGILGMLDLLSTPALNPDQREQVDTAAASADSLLRILNDILDFSRIEHGDLQFESAPFRPAAVTEEILARLRPRAATRDVELQLTADAGASLRVMGDSTRFRQVLLNLIGNAVKFSDHDRVVVELQGTELPGQQVRLTVRVRDRGIGMTDEMRARLFTPFTQADSSLARKHGGAGLGLAISQRLVQGMGGTIAVTSAVGAGSVFEFSLALPLARGRETALPFGVSGALPQHFDARVLVVEDDPINQRVITLMLQRFGLPCQVVADGPAALDAIEAGSWDLIFMDLQLPGIDGFETTRRARRLLGKREVPIVALTANTRPEDRAACTAAGMDDFLPKPVRSEALQTCLARWLQTTA